MARTIAEIKKDMTDTFFTSILTDNVLKAKYGIQPGDTYDSKFSKASLENILFYCIAVGLWMLENLFDTHREEVRADLDARTPHTVRWYRNLVLGFTKSDGTQPVSYCSIDDRFSKLRVKVAGITNDVRGTISSADKAALESFLDENKDAGMKIEVINEDNDRLKLTANVYYDPMYLDPSAKPVEAAVRDYVANLDFDGLMTRNGLVDAMLEVDGCMIADITLLQTKYANGAFADFGQQQRPVSGYWSVPADYSDISITYIRYTKEAIA